MSIQSPAFIISLCFLLLGFVFNTMLINANTLYKNEKEKLAESLSYKKRFLDKEEWHHLKEIQASGLDYNKKQLSFILAYESSEAGKQRYQQQQQSIAQAASAVQKHVYLLLGLILCYVLLIMALFIKSQSRLILLLGSISIAIICLHAGLFNPMLEIGAIEKDFNLGEIPIQKQILGVTIDLSVQKTFSGDIYFYYQNKSIAELIHLLFAQNNWIVGFSILLFSIFFPVIKTLLMIIYLFKPAIAQQKWFNSFVLNLSKWSMADVFVVAIFLGFLAFSNLQAGVGTYSNTLVGLYFFLAYCLLSIAGSMLVNKRPSS